MKIQAITIEGFKGYTEEQRIEVEGRHIFVFGPNGYGKSSFLEAVRWCLFGLTGRPEEMVRNQFYEGECIVELEIDDQGERYRLQRRMKPGSSHSRLTIWGPGGNEVPQQILFPFLTSLGPREGTYIIFGGPSQLPSRTRPLESIEISDFGRIIYAYLRLGDVPDLIEQLDEMIELQHEAEREIDAHLEHEEGKMADRIKDVEERVRELLVDPPWGEGLPPSRTETSAKVTAAVQELATLKGQTPPTTLNEEDRVVLAMNWLQGIVLPQENVLKQKIALLQENQLEAESLLRQLESTESSAAELHRRVDLIGIDQNEVIDGQQVADLKEELKGLEQAVTLSGHRIQLGRLGRLLWEEEDAEVCPLCAGQIDGGDMVSHLDELEEEEGSAILDERDRIGAQVDRWHSLEDRRERLQMDLASISMEAGDFRQRLRGLLRSADISATTVAEYVERLDAERTVFEKSLRSEQDLRMVWGGRLNLLRAELRFHRWRTEKEELIELRDTVLHEIRAEHAELEQIGASLREVRSGLVAELLAVLEQTLPVLGELMTEVYHHLTNQVSFDNVVLSMETDEADPTPRLLVRVRSSSSEDLSPLDPEQVLNGQALNALRLVPYFVFSRFQHDAWGIDLLLLDDPTQSFDVERIELLMEELKSAAGHAQLIIGTHERDRFEDPLSRMFEASSLALVRVEGFSVESGPKLNLQLLN